MKKIFSVIIPALILVLAQCETEKGPMLKDTVTPPVITSPASGTNLVMTKPQSDTTMVFTWTPADYGVPVGTLYTLQASKAADNFAHSVDIESVNTIGDTLTYAEFNAKMVALETVMESSNPVLLRVKASIPQSHADTVFSAPVTLNVTPYTAKDFIYIVGQHNGWDNTTANVMNRNLPGLKYELFLNLPAVNEGFKILPTLGSWDGDIGDDPANPGKLIATGEQNIKVPDPGFYRISVDLQAMTWTATKMNWSLIGDFNSWGADYPMAYDPVNKVLVATVNIPAAGALKFRANGNWDLNFGDTGADGKLDAGGDNIMIPAAGNYRITLNLTPEGNPQVYTYTVTKL